MNKRYILLTLFLIILCLILNTACTRYVDKEKSDFYVYTNFGRKVSFRQSRQLGNGFAIPPIPLNPEYTEMDVDVKTFEVIDGFIAKDKNHVYWRASIMGGADAATFHIDSTNIVRDKNSIYHWNHKGTRPKAVEHLDAGTYEALDNYNWGKDKNNYYYDYHPLEVDMQTFEILNYIIAFDRNNIYDFDKGYPPKVIPAKGKIVRLSGRALHDDDTLFLYCNSIGPSTTGIHKVPIKDLHSIKYYGTADYCTLWGMDGKVYWDTKDMGEEQVDAASFQFIDFRFAKDRNKVYFNGDIIGGADPNTFIVKERFLACDKSKVYMGKDRINGADPKTIRLEEYKLRSFPVDKNHRYKYNNNSRKWEIDNGSV